MKTDIRIVLFEKKEKPITVGGALPEERVEYSVESALHILATCMISNRSQGRNEYFIPKEFLNQTSLKLLHLNGYDIVGRHPNGISVEISRFQKPCKKVDCIHNIVGVCQAKGVKQICNAYNPMEFYEVTINGQKETRVKFKYNHENT